MLYSKELTNAMTLLGKLPHTVFIGQSVAYPGNAIYKTLAGIPPEKRLELPVAEELQMGMSIGMALTGKIIISIYPRFDFLLLAVNQLVNHLDKLREYTHGEYSARVIIRVGIGATEPMYPGVQHCGDYTEAFKKMLKNINVVKLESCDQIIPAYERAYNSEGSSLIVEDTNLYRME